MWIQKQIVVTSTGVGSQTNTIYTVPAGSVFYIYHVEVSTQETGITAVMAVSESGVNFLTGAGPQARIAEDYTAPKLVAPGAISGTFSGVAANNHVLFTLWGYQE